MGRKAKDAPVEEEKLKSSEEELKEEETTDEVEEELKEEGPVDYLRQYQVRKGAVMGSKKSDPQPGSKAEIIKAKLLAQPKVRILIPREKKESKTFLATVNLNGYRLDFPKQAYVDVPSQVADVLMQSQEQTDMALERDLISASEDKMKVLS